MIQTLGAVPDKVLLVGNSKFSSFFSLVDGPSINRLLVIPIFIKNPFLTVYIDIYLWQGLNRLVLIVT